ncbi:MAG: hypothetical protein COW00_14505 [Bdellovibrio sp. CG12_big_fil_rev_8_21_14_0_65_39_13]|nr:MAG: hypothetical protein COW78_07755 [Bdellovibrio sp. CG22_combo_CG10-13_8_21_14_all_39_27]PIQ58823.1 MAG: hypothetical protein COW00_14505 [Bdellovibrio sp. CG12_big_fil_rev_8_21_14_0_65_39_13]PIR35499.1 MAG: hypothetical protein COV37_08445 [Bdellovibrio sp. CG11_big_fil_rev_8_21_14_0_20_39_38]
MKSLVSSLMLLTLLSSCATFFSKSDDQVTFKTSPEGVTVYLDGDIIGTTPLTHTIKRQMGIHEITLKKEGYKTQSFTLKKSIATAAFFNSTFILSWGTDALTGKMFEYSPNSYFFDLESNKTSSNLQEAWKFVTMNFQALLNDIAKNGGEYSKNYSKLIGKNHAQFVQKMKVQLPEILKMNNPIQFQEKALTL